MSRSILIIDDEELIRRSLSRTFAAAGYTAQVAASGNDALAILSQETPACVMVDLRLGDMSGLDLMRTVRDSMPSCKFVVITAHGDVDSAVEALRLGAFDFIRKPFDLEEVLATVNNALRVDALEAQVAYLNARVSPQPGGALFESAAMRQCMDLLEKIASQPVPIILVRGESGAGKQLAARRIHDESARAAGPFIELNCSTLPEQLVESELFGHERGAFSDAKEAKRGLVELADGGTLFLDEIGDLPAAAQAKLLKFVEGQEFRRVGGTQTKRVDCRIVAATHKNLEHDVNFRRDLYYRLGGISIMLPPLRERGADILLLAHHFLRDYAGQYRKRISGFSAAAEQLLQGYAWPGNIRELKAVISYAVIRSDGPVVQAEVLDALHPPHLPRNDPHIAQAWEQMLPLEDVVRAYCAKITHLCGGNKVLAAQRLGISRHTLARKLDEEIDASALSAKSE